MSRVLQEDSFTLLQEDGFPLLQEDAALATDDFNRADAATLGANWTDDANFSGMAIVSNRATADAGAEVTGTAAWTADLGSVDMYSQVTVTVPADAAGRLQYDGAGATVRHDPTGGGADYYYAELYHDHDLGTAFNLYRTVAGTAVVLATTAATTGTKVIKLTATGTNPVLVSMYVDGVLTLSFSDSNALRIQTGQKAGIVCFRFDYLAAGGAPTTTGVNATYVDDFSADIISSQTVARQLIRSAARVRAATR